jgi:radical SAM enzyme (TIGR01210 family)
VDSREQRFCVNKTIDATTVRGAIDTIRSYGGSTYVNVSLGTAILNESEAIQDAATSVATALRWGADLILIFPMHVRENTLLAWLHREALYQPPSLWSFARVLDLLPEALLPRINLSWYRADYGDRRPIASPTSCSKFEHRLLSALDAYRENPSARALRRIQMIECCREQAINQGGRRSLDRIRRAGRSSPP